MVKQRLKQIIVFMFLFVAGATMFLHLVVPHYHHDDFIVEHHDTDEHESQHRKQNHEQEEGHSHPCIHQHDEVILPSIFITHWKQVLQISGNEIIH